MANAGMIAGRGATFRRNREKMGWSQTEAGQAVGKRKNTIARYERDELDIPVAVFNLLAAIAAKAK